MPARRVDAVEAVRERTDAPPQQWLRVRYGVDSGLSVVVSTTRAVSGGGEVDEPGREKRGLGAGRAEGVARDAGPQPELGKREGVVGRSAFGYAA